MTKTNSSSTSTTQMLKALNTPEKTPLNNSLFEFSADGIRVGNWHWNKNLAIQNTMLLLTLILFMDKINTTNARPSSVTYFSDPTGNTNYEVSTYSKSHVINDIGDQIKQNCHPNMTAIISAVAYYIIHTVSDSMEYSRGVNQLAAPEFENCVIKEMEYAYDQEKANDTVTIIIALSALGPFVLGTLCVGLICLLLLVYCGGKHLMKDVHFHKKTQKSDEEQTELSDREDNDVEYSLEEINSPKTAVNQEQAESLDVETVDIENNTNNEGSSLQEAETGVNDMSFSYRM